MASQEQQQPHIVAVPYPAQGHVKPLLSLCYKIASLHGGIKVTFVNAEYIHGKIMATISDQENVGLKRSGISMVSIPDGLLEEEEGDPLLDFELFTKTIRRVMPVELKKLITSINNDEEKEEEAQTAVSCVIADATLGWILDDEIVGVMVKKVSFVPFGPASLALFSCIPNLIQSGIMDSTTGVILENEEIKVSEDIPPWKNRELMWTIPGDEKFQKAFFQVCLTAKETVENTNYWLLCNTFYELDPFACNLIPRIMPIGPLQMTESIPLTKNSSSGNFWAEDTSCLSWLDTQLPSTVVYVSFGSTSMLSQNQFNELALGLEQSGHPFLWVVRPNSTITTDDDDDEEKGVIYPERFLDRMNGKIVEWAPQEKVLAHHSIACFLSHCGWNSTMEGVCSGVPFLCWPYYADQLHNQKYICDVWKIGLRVNPDDEETGIRSRQEIKRKIEELTSDSTIKMNALKLKELARGSVNKGGSSYENFEKFIDYLKLI